ADLGWDPLNLLSTVGTYVLAAGVLLFTIDLVVRFRPGQGQDNPWRAGTLEWLPTDLYSTRSIPLVTSREPLWDQPGLARDVAEGRYFLPGTLTGGRETLVTSPVEARPQYVIRMPGPGWPPFLAAVFMASFFLLLTVKAVVPAVACGVLMIVFCIAWAWSLDPGPGREVDIGGGIRLPTYMSGPRSHSWWAMVVLMFVAASLYLAWVFSYLFLWTVSPEAWSPHGAPALPAWRWPAASVLLLLAGSGLLLGAQRGLPRRGERAAGVPWQMLLALACLAAARRAGGLHAVPIAADARLPGGGVGNGVGGAMGQRAAADEERLRGVGVHGGAAVRPARVRHRDPGRLRHRAPRHRATRPGTARELRQPRAPVPLHRRAEPARPRAGARVPAGGGMKPGDAIQAGDDRGSPAAALAYLVVGPLAWAGHLLLVYAPQAALCAFRLTGTRSEER